MRRIETPEDARRVLEAEVVQQQEGNWLPQMNLKFFVWLNVDCDAHYGITASGKRFYALEDYDKGPTEKRFFASLDEQAAHLYAQREDYNRAVQQMTRQAVKERHHA